tara:strand:+ start:209 stop:616 length:408 start_codon:yes stop_codon:yes gene_type:complete
MNQLSHKIQIPWWLYIILFMEIWPMFVGPYLALNNPAFLGGPEASTLVVGSLIYLARNFAVGFAFLIAIYLKNPSMLFILIFIRLFTDLIDGPAFLAFGMAVNEIRLISLFVLGYYIPAIFALFYLWKQIRTSND